MPEFKPEKFKRLGARPATNRWRVVHRSTVTGKVLKVLFAGTLRECELYREARGTPKSWRVGISVQRDPS